MSQRLHARARQVEGRMVVRAWELRQERHAKGVWYRLRRLLALAERVYAVSGADFDALVAAGHALEPAGRELSPERRITTASQADVARLASARELRVKLDAALLAEENWVLVPFDAAPDRQPGDPLA